MGTTSGPKGRPLLSEQCSGVLVDNNETASTLVLTELGDFIFVDDRGDNGPRKS